MMVLSLLHTQVGELRDVTGHVYHHVINVQLQRSSFKK